MAKHELIVLERIDWRISSALVMGGLSQWDAVIKLDGVRAEFATAGEQPIYQLCGLNVDAVVGRIRTERFCR